MGREIITYSDSGQELSAIALVSSLQFINEEVIESDHQRDAKNARNQQSVESAFENLKLTFCFKFYRNPNFLVLPSRLWSVVELSHSIQRKLSESGKFRLQRNSLPMS